MQIITSGLLMISAAGITLGVVHLRFWISQRERRDQLAFALACISLGVFVVFEIGMLRAETPQEYGSVLTWAQIAASIHMVACAWFMKVNLDGRPSLFWLIFGLRGASTVINLFTYPESMNFTRYLHSATRPFSAKRFLIRSASPTRWLLFRRQECCC